MKRMIWAVLLLAATLPAQQRYEGKYFRGKGDAEYLRLLDTARRMFAPDAELQSTPMFYEPRWNGYTEGPTWDAWWIQNSYGPTYASLPFLQEPYTTFIENSQRLWWDQMGDGKRVGAPPPYDFIAPDGALCDAARPGFIIYKQGDGNVAIHDWGYEFTAAAMVLQAESLLISRDRKALAFYLPKIERSADFIEASHDLSNNLFLVGAASNLMAPSYAGYKRPDGTYGRAYLAGLSITYMAALDRLIELERLGGTPERAELYRKRRELARLGLAQLMTPEGYFVKSVDPDGTKHGVYGAPKHGYFETAPNHDAIAFRIVDDAQANKIYDKIASIPGLRPYDLIITNFPSLDDMYTEAKDGFRFGHWVNGGHWSTCEGRMMLAYSRLGKYEDSRRSMKRIVSMAERFRMDNNLTDFGNGVYQPDLPINVVYDTYAVPAALVRGLFEYLYRADGLTVLPHIPSGVTELEQAFPVRFGEKRLYLSTYGNGPVTGVRVNGQPWKTFDKVSVTFAPEGLPDEARVDILMGGASAGKRSPIRAERNDAFTPAAHDELKVLNARTAKVVEFRRRLIAAGLGASYEAAHAGAAIEMARATNERFTLRDAGKLKRLPEVSQKAADQSYIDTAIRLMDGLEKVVGGYEKSTDAQQKKIYEVYRQ